jgi:hypothetical protein
LKTSLPHRIKLKGESITKIIKVCNARVKCTLDLVMLMLVGCVKIDATFKK